MDKGQELSINFREWAILYNVVTESFLEMMLTTNGDNKIVWNNSFPDDTHKNSSHKVRTLDWGSVSAGHAPQMLWLEINQCVTPTNIYYWLLHITSLINI